MTYDGVNTLRLFLDGHAVVTQTTTTMSGTISQQSHEDVSVGPETSGLYGAVRYPALPGFIDSLRLSRVARYTADFAVPTAKFAGDANTRVLLNFTKNVGITTWDATSKYVYPIVRTAEPDGSPEKTVRVTLKNFGLLYRGVFAVNATNSQFLDLHGALSDGIVLAGKSSGTLLDNISLYYGRYGAVLVNADDSVIHNVEATYSPIPLVVNGGSNVQITNFSGLSGGTKPEYMAYFLQADVDVVALSLDVTAGGPLRGYVVVDRPTAPFQLYKGHIGTSTAPTAITIDGGQGYIIEGTTFSGSQSDHQAIHLNSPLAQGAQHLALGVHVDPGTTLSDDPNIQVVSTLGH
jgi:hypothetical protein